MKLLVATSTHQTKANDFTFTTEGEIVNASGYVCDSDQRNLEAGCGCGRSFIGIDTRRGTTTAVVIDSPLTRAQVRSAIRASQVAAGYRIDAKEIDAMVEDNLDIANHYEIGDVVERRGYNYFRRLTAEQNTALGIA